MQKKIIALAVAALASSAAFAQTNVTVYGVVDLGQAYVKSSDAATTQGSVGRLDNNASYVGFKGTEDLGNGLKAVFQLETGYNSDNATGWGSARDTYVGLAGGFGTVLVGNLTHALRIMGNSVSMFAGNAGVGTTNSITGTIAGLQTGADNRAKNAVAYLSPSMGGVTLVAAYVNGENKTNSTAAADGINQKSWQVAALYGNGPLNAGLGYHKAYDLNGVAATAVNEQDARVVRAYATYTLPSATKLTALYDNTKVDHWTAAGDLKRTAWSLGVAQPFGKSTVGLEYARAGKLKLGGDSIDETQNHIVSALYSYDLSKRTQLHARYSKLTNDDASNTNFYNNPVSDNGATSTVGADYTGIMVGLRHTF